MSRCDNAAASAAHSCRYSSLHRGHWAPFASTITAIAAAGFAAATSSARWPTRSASSSQRSARITDPSSPAANDTRTSDFSGTKPRMAGSAAISVAGRLSSNCPRYFVMNATLTTGTVSRCPRHAIELPSCGRRRNCAFYCHFMGSMREYDIVVIGSGPSPATTSSSPLAPGRHGHPESNLTKNGCSTPTGSSISNRCHPRWSWSVPA